MPLPQPTTNEYLSAIAKHLNVPGKPTPFSYTDRDAILYNLGVGAKRSDLRYVYEGADDFQLLPTFGVIPAFDAEPAYTLDELVPNFNPMMLLHGEQYLEIKKYPVPTSGRLVSRAKLIEVVDKGGAAVVRSGVTTVEEATGDEVFYNEMVVFLRGCGGFGGAKKAKGGRGGAEVVAMPGRRADVVVEEGTGEGQAAVYRLSGDYKYVSLAGVRGGDADQGDSPLHIDPAFAKMGGFKQPILHGLCFFGIAGKAVYEK